MLAQRALAPIVPDEVTKPYTLSSSLSEQYLQAGHVFG